MPLFTYPDYGSPSGFPDHVARSGQQCTIVRELGDDERDPEVGRMFMARFSDGIELCVNGDELDVLPPRPIGGQDRWVGTSIPGVIVGADFDDGEEDKTIIVRIAVPADTSVGFSPVTITVQAGSGSVALAALAPEAED